MPLTYKPDIGEIWRVQPVEAGRRIEKFERVFGGAISGQLTEKSPRRFSQEYGLEATRPALFLCDLGPLIRAGDRLTFGSQQFRVLADARVCDSEPLTSHLEVYLEQI